MARNIRTEIIDLDDSEYLVRDAAVPGESSDDERNNEDDDPGVIRQVATSFVTDKVEDAVARKGIPLKGIEDVAARPTSVKAWAQAGLRTGVSMALSSVTGAFGGYIEELINKVGYKRSALMLAVLAVCSTLMVFVMVTTLVASVTEAVVKPVSVIGSLLDSIPGYGPDDEQMKGIPDRMCPVPPPPRAAQSVPETAAPESEEDESSQDSGFSIGFVPDPAIDKDGKITPEARALMREPGITRSVDPLRVETWMLYALSHPKSDPNASWDGFGGVYRAAYNYVAKQKGLPDLDEIAQNSNRSVNVEPQGLKPVRTDITPIELVMQIDPTAYYDPFLLAAATMTAYLAMEPDRLNQTDDQLSSVIGRMQALCGM